MQLVVAHERPEVHLLRCTGELLNLCLILFVFFQLFLKAALPFLGVEAVIAAVKLRLPVAYLNAALGNFVEKPAVVAYRQDCTLEVQQVVLKPLGCVQVEVVGRLVQKENVRVLKDEAGKVHAGLFAAGETVEALREHCGSDVQTVCHAAAVGIHVVAAETAKVVLKSVVFR